MATDVKSDEVAPERPVDVGVEAVRRVAETPKADKVSAEDQNDALQWFLQDGDDEPLTHTLEINVGGPDEQKWIPWTIKAIDSGTLKRVRQLADSANRATRRSGGSQVDTSVMNLLIVAAGTVEPDLRAAAQAKGVTSPDPLEGPSRVLKHRFRHKPGLVDMLMNEIMSLSGYDDDDVREQREVAAGEG